MPCNFPERPMRESEAARADLYFHVAVPVATTRGGVNVTWGEH